MKITFSKSSVKLIFCFSLILLYSSCTTSLIKENEMHKLYLKESYTNNARLFSFYRSPCDTMKSIFNSYLFLLPITTVSVSISGHTIVRGKVEKGNIKEGEKIEVVGFNKKKISDRIIKLENDSRNLSSTAEAGDNITIWLEKTEADKVTRGMVVAETKSIKAHTKFIAELYMLSKEENGPHTPFFNNFRPVFFFRTTNVTGNILLPEGTGMVMPGDFVSIMVTLEKPVAIEEGLKFTIKDRGKSVGCGLITKVL